MAGRRLEEESENEKKLLYNRFGHDARRVRTDRHPRIGCHLCKHDYMHSQSQ
jgi:hypothetical protein